MILDQPELETSVYLAKREQDGVNRVLSKEKIVLCGFWDGLDGFRHV